MGEQRLSLGGETGLRAKIHSIGVHIPPLLGEQTAEMKKLTSVPLPTLTNDPEEGVGEGEMQKISPH